MTDDQKNGTADYGGPNGRSPKGSFRPNWGDSFDPSKPRGSVDPTPNRCNARNEWDRYCRKWPIRGRSRCQFHGGSTPSGLAAPQFKTGRWSQSLPGQLAARYDRLVADQDILNLSHDLALLDVRIEELQQRLATQESETAWKKARELYQDLRTAITSSDKDGILSNMQSLGTLLRSATGIDETWREIRESLLERRLLVETERRRLVDMHQMVTVEELLILMTRISAIVRERVSDPREQQLIARDVQDLLGAGGRIAAQALAKRPMTVQGSARTVE